MSRNPCTTLLAGSLLVAVALAGCDKKASDNGERYYDVWSVMPTAELPPVRHWQVRRGILHAHSTYSHDACDGQPFPGGQRNAPCLADMRLGMCTTRQDFVFLTDHDDHYAEHEYPDVLLYLPEQGDTLIEVGGDPVANRVDCGDGHEVIVAAGTESALMVFGLDRHVGATVNERKAVLNTVSATNIDIMRAEGGLIFLQHTEDWDATTIVDLPIDGIEIYNLHYGMIANAGPVGLMLFDSLDHPERVPEGDAALIAAFLELDLYLSRWATALGHKRVVGIIASDTHQNTFDELLPDGERLDSYRRIMRWFSNHVLVPSGPVDHQTIREGIRRGRTYGAFEYLGYPVGFDFRAESGPTTYEMGEQVPVGDTPTLHVTVPSVWRLDPAGPQPQIRVRILRATADAWEEVASGESDLAYAATTPGVYRADVRIIPHHLRAWLGSEPDRFLAAEMPWIYSNPIYVGTDYPPAP